MVAYNFQEQFAGAVRNGTKHLTLRAPRKGRARHARLGEVLQLTVRARTKNVTPLLTQPICTFRADVVLAPEGIRRVLNPEARAGDGRAEGLLRLVQAAENGSPDAAKWRDAFAKLDGFADYASMYAWHRDSGRDEGKEAGGVIRRALIGWTAH